MTMGPMAAEWSDRVAMEWYYAKHGKQEGPVPVGRLKELLDAGQVAPTDLVWREGMAEWLPAAQVGELTGAGVPVQSSMVGGGAPPQAGYEPPRHAPSPHQQVPNYLVPSILVTIFCCWPLGIPAIVFAAKVDGLVSRGDMQGAMEASRKAKMWTWISFGSGILSIFLYVVFLLAMEGL